MKFYEYGDKKNPVVLFFHAALTNPSMYQPILQLLAKNYYVIAPEADGHSLSERTKFRSVSDNVKKTEGYLISQGITKIHGLYGVSMGGAFALRFLANNKIPVEKAIIDGGITPYDFCGNEVISEIRRKVILMGDLIMILTIRYAGMHCMKKNPMCSSYSKHTLKRLVRILRNMSLGTAIRVFDSTNNYPLPKRIPMESKNIQYWFGSKEIRERQDNMKSVRMLVPRIKVREFPGLQHAELILEHPQQAAKEITAFFEDTEK